MNINSFKERLKQPKVVAEIGCNHMGSFEIATQMIDEAIKCGATVAKFQKRNSKELLSNEQYNAPHPVPYNSYGNTYGEHREALEFTVEQHIELKQYAEEKGIVYSTSVWDMTSAVEITKINPKMIKIPSATNLNFNILDWLCLNYEGELHLSFGMTTKDEEAKIVKLFSKHNRAKDLVIYACTSGYPVPMEDVCLLEIKRLIASYGDVVKSVGYSGHNNGIAVDLVAYALGAEWIERHFTMDRTWKGTDHAASLEPAGLARLVRDLQNIHSAYSYKPTDILAIEKPQREKLKWVAVSE